MINRAKVENPIRTMVNLVYILLKGVLLLGNPFLLNNLKKHQRSAVICRGSKSVPFSYSTTGGEIKYYTVVMEIKALYNAWTYRIL